METDPASRDALNALKDRAVIAVGTLHKQATLLQDERNAALAERDRYRAALEELRGHSAGDPIRIENIIDEALGGDGAF